MTKKKITAYKMQTNNVGWRFEQEICKLLQDGWQPLGLPSITQWSDGHDSNPIYSQAMVKYE